MSQNQSEKRKPQITVLREHLTDRQPDIKRALSGRIPEDYFIRVALNAMQANPAILRCDEPSILLSLMHAASLGLAPDGFLGYAYLVPFKGQCRLIIGAQGYLELARRSGALKIEAHAVYEEDEFDIQLGSDPRIIHRPNPDVIRNDSTLANIRAFYAIAFFPNGRTIFDWMQTGQVERIAGMARASNVWKEHPVQMGIKTMIRRLAKRLPLAGDFRSAIALENAVDETGQMPALVGDAFTSDEGLAPTDGSRTAEVKDHILGNGGAPETDAPAADESEPDAAQARGAPPPEDDLPFEDVPNEDMPETDEEPPDAGTQAGF